MGASSLEPKSTLYVLSFLIISTWTIPMLSVLNGVAALVIIVGVILWHLTFFRVWDGFPSKVYFFLRLFYLLFLLIFTSTFLLFQICESYKTAVGVSTLELMGLCSLVLVVTMLILSILEAVFLLFLTFYRLCKSNSNAISNLGSSEKSE